MKQAEAEAESKRLQGEGIANQRKAIISGLKDSVEDFAKAVQGSTPQDVMQLVLMTYFDTLKDIAANDRSNTVLIPHTPNTLTPSAPSDAERNFRGYRIDKIAGNHSSRHLGPPAIIGSATALKPNQTASPAKTLWRATV